VVFPKVHFYISASSLLLSLDGRTDDDEVHEGRGTLPGQKHRKTPEETLKPPRKVIS
jgi:hypothetical protein